MKSNLNKMKKKLKTKQKKEEYRNEFFFCLLAC